MKFTGSSKDEILANVANAKWASGENTHLIVAPLWATDEPNLDNGNCIKVS